jgi:Tol biopolymer transport system component
MYYLYLVDAHNPASPEKLAGPVETVRPTWSPDGDEIAFVTVDGIKAVRQAGGPERTVFEVDPEAVLIVEVSWSPDGRSIAFVATERRKAD